MVVIHTLKFDAGGQDMIVGTRYAGTTNNLLVLGPGLTPDTTTGIFVKGNSNVGINEDDPAYPLEVVGDGGGSFAASSNSESGKLSIVGKNSSGGISAISRLKSYPDGSSNQSHFALETRNSSNKMVEALRIASDGNVGIGSAIPTAKLDIADAAQTNLLTLKRTSGNSGIFSVQLGGSDPGVLLTTSGISDDFVFRPGGNERLRINASGQLIMTNTATTTFLDASTTSSGTNTRELISLAG